MKRLEPTPLGGRGSGSTESEQDSVAVSQPDDDLFAQDDFLKLVLIVCRSVFRRLNLGGRDPAYGPDDFHHDTFMKLLKARGCFRPQNIPNEKAMVNLLYTVALNRGRSKLREWRRHRQMQVSCERVEDLPEGDSGIDLVREWIVQELMGFTRSLPEERRRALVLKLEGYSFREISRIFLNEGHKVSHVTIQKWYEASLQHVLAKAS